MNNQLYSKDRERDAYLELIIGPMYAGKTSKIIDIYKQCQFCNIPVVVINHSLDTRYDNTMLSTHDKIKIPCIKTNSLKKIWNKIICDKKFVTYRVVDHLVILKYSKVILINEAQFFDDLFEVVNEMLALGKHVYVCGLDGDFERKKFGQILDLIPLCDKVTKLTSLCSKCKSGTPGIFSMRLTGEKEQTVVGSSNYIPVCRGCYKTNTSS